MADIRQRIINVLKLQTIGAGASTLSFWLYFLAITSAELLTVYLQPMVGVLCHGLILIALLIQSGLTAEPQQRNLTLALGLAPLIRIISLSLPLVQLPQVYWYPLIYAPLLAATVVVIWMVGLKAKDVGLVRRELLFQISLGLVSGLAFGTVEYLIIRPEPLVTGFTFQQVWLPALILLSTTGFVEELMFRGVLQCLAGPAMGSWRGITYVSLIFAILHVGFFSVLDVIFVLFVALFFGAIVKWTGSLIGVTLSHGIANILLYLVLPFALG